MIRGRHVMPAPSILSPAHAVALRTSFAFKAKRAPVLVRADALRRADLVLRATTYEGVVVDERVLTRAFPWIGARHALALIMLRGRVLLEGAYFGPGDVLLMRPDLQAVMRFEETAFLDLEWASDAPPTHTCVRITPNMLERATHLATRMRAREFETRALLTEALDVFDAVGGLPPRPQMDELIGGPSARDIAVAEALRDAFSNFDTELDTTHLCERIGISPRQLQRILVDFGRTYGLSLTGWRELRNRWRVQLAAVLCGRTELTVQDIAQEVGFASAQALTRALTKAGLPAPGRLRELLAYEPSGIKLS
jgi:AraC-like DNA-binding protein